MNEKMPAPKGRGLAFGGKTQINIHLATHLKIFSKVLATLVFLIGFFAVLGWQFEIDIFKKVAPSLPVIAPNTACSFVLIGLFLFFLNWTKENHKFMRSLVSFLSILIAILGMLTLIEYIFRLNFGIDRLFFARKMGTDIVRMSPQSALNFLLVGMALSFYSSKEKKHVFWGQIAIVAAGIMALVSLFGFIYGVAGLYTIAPYKGMAAHTAIAFVLTFLGILMLRPETGLVRIFASRGLSGMAARRLLAALLSILVIEILVMLGAKTGFYSFSYEALVHLLIVTGVFIFLIFYSFRSLDRLAEAEKSLEHLKEVDRAKTDFVSLASHQLRTPLTSVSWYSEMLLRHEVGPLNPKQKEYLDEVYAQNRRMIDLVDDLLNSSRIDMGMLNIEPRKTDLKIVLGSALDEIDPLVREKKIDLEKNIAENLPAVETDPEMIRIIFQNLISNAVKYTPEGGKVKVALSPVGSHLEFKVADTGYGITKSQQNRVFTKMFRADNIRSKVTDGTGLGLYIAKAIAKELGGKLHFDSEENKGTTFFLELPVRFHR
ncbi:MAG: HAMP domain-containing sensor histidine kinase [Candidatus Moranbacteria bacterium]|nr:HAMP domain-containing sensor histidine kinase [Candidatus Moranbacteria bacterium]